MASDALVVSEYRARAAVLRERLDDLALGVEEGVLTIAGARRSSERQRAGLTSVDVEAALEDEVTLGPRADGWQTLARQGI